MCSESLRNVYLCLWRRLLSWNRHCQTWVWPHPAFLWILFAKRISYQPLTLSLLLYVPLTSVSQRAHRFGVCFLIQSSNKGASLLVSIVHLYLEHLLILEDFLWPFCICFLVTLYLARFSSFLLLRVLLFCRYDTLGSSISFIKLSVSGVAFSRVLTIKFRQSVHVYESA